MMKIVLEQFEFLAPDLSLCVACSLHLILTSLPERGPEEINTIGVCSLQELGDLKDKR